MLKKNTGRIWFVLSIFNSITNKTKLKHVENLTIQSIISAALSLRCSWVQWRWIASNKYFEIIIVQEFSKNKQEMPLNVLSIGISQVFFNIISMCRYFARIFLLEWLCWRKNKLKRNDKIKIWLFLNNSCHILIDIYRRSLEHKWAIPCALNKALNGIRYKSRLLKRKLDDTRCVDKWKWNGVLEPISVSPLVSPLRIWSFKHKMPFEMCGFRHRNDRCIWAIDVAIPFESGIPRKHLHEIVKTVFS